MDSNKATVPEDVEEIADGLGAMAVLGCPLDSVTLEMEVL